jgi:Flp pilus assembly protein TadG
MKMVRKFRRDQQGAAAIEFAIAVPILILMIWGIFQVGIAFQASAGMQHALGEGARYATIWPVPTNTQIAARISAKTFGTGNGTFSTPSVTNGTNYKDLSVTFTMPMNFLFFNGPTLSLTRTKRVYTAA